MEQATRIMLVGLPGDATIIVGLKILVFSRQKYSALAERRRYTYGKIFCRQVGSTKIISPILKTWIWVFGSGEGEKNVFIFLRQWCVMLIQQAQAKEVSFLFIMATEI